MKHTFSRGKHLVEIISAAPAWNHHLSSHLVRIINTQFWSISVVCRFLSFCPSAAGGNLLLASHYLILEHFWAAPPIIIIDRASVGHLTLIEHVIFGGGVLSHYIDIKHIWIIWFARHPAKVWFARFSSTNASLFLLELLPAASLLLLRWFHFHTSFLFLFCQLGEDVIYNLLV